MQNNTNLYIAFQLPVSEINFLDKIVVTNLIPEASDTIYKTNSDGHMQNIL